MGAKTYEQDGWVIEECSFHPSVWPSEVTYRHQPDGPLQVKNTWDFRPTTEGLLFNSLDSAVLERFKRLLTTCHDLSIEYKHDIVWISGWQDVVSEDGRRIYQNDIRDSM